MHAERRVQTRPRFSFPAGEPVTASAALGLKGKHPSGAHRIKRLAATMLIGGRYRKVLVTLSPHALVMERCDRQVRIVACAPHAIEQGGDDTLDHDIWTGEEAIELFRLGAVERCVISHHNRGLLDFNRFPSQPFVQYGRTVKNPPYRQPNPYHGSLDAKVVLDLHGFRSGTHSRGIILGIGRVDELTMKEGRFVGAVRGGASFGADLLTRIAREAFRRIPEMTLELHASLDLAHLPCTAGNTPRVVLTDERLAKMGFVSGERVALGLIHDRSGRVAGVEACRESADTDGELIVNSGDNERVELPKSFKPTERVDLSGRHVFRFTGRGFRLREGSTFRRYLPGLRNYTFRYLAQKGVACVQVEQTKDVRKSFAQQLAASGCVFRVPDDQRWM